MRTRDESLALFLRRKKKFVEEKGEVQTKPGCPNSRRVSCHLQQLGVERNEASPDNINELSMPDCCPTAVCLLFVHLHLVPGGEVSTFGSPQGHFRCPNGVATDSLPLASVLIVIIGHFASNVCYGCENRYLEWMIRGICTRCTLGLHTSNGRINCARLPFLLKTSNSRPEWPSSLERSEFHAWKNAARVRQTDSLSRIWAGEEDHVIWVSHDRLRVENIRVFSK